MYELEPYENMSTADMVDEYVAWLGIASVDSVCRACQEEGRNAAEAIGSILWKQKIGTYKPLPGQRLKYMPDDNVQATLHTVPRQIDIETTISLLEDRLPEPQSS